MAPFTMVPIQMTSLSPQPQAQPRSHSREPQKSTAIQGSFRESKRRSSLTTNRRTSNAHGNTDQNLLCSPAQVKNDDDQPITGNDTKMFTEHEEISDHTSFKQLAEQDIIPKKNSQKAQDPDVQIETTQRYTKKPWQTKARQNQTRASYISRPT